MSATRRTLTRSDYADSVVRNSLGEGSHPRNSRDLNEERAAAGESAGGVVVSM